MAEALSLGAHEAAGALSEGLGGLLFGASEAGKRTCGGGELEARLQRGRGLFALVGLRAQVAPVASEVREAAPIVALATYCASTDREMSEVVSIAAKQFLKKNPL